MSLSQHLTCSLAWRLSKPPGSGVLRGASSYRHGQLSTPFPAPLPSLETRGGGARRSQLLTVARSSWCPAPFQDPTLITQEIPRIQEPCVSNQGQRQILEQKTLLELLSLRKFQGFRSLVQGPRGEANPASSVISQPLSPLGMTPNSSLSLPGRPCQPVLPGCPRPHLGSEGGL